MHSFHFSRFVFLFLFLVTIITGQNNENAFVLKGDEAFAEFDNNRALDNYAKAVAVDSTDYEANWKLSRAYVDIGDTYTDEDKRAEYFKKSEEYARNAIKIEPDGSYGHLYLSIALGRLALDAGAKQRIKMSKEIKKEADLAIKLDPKNDLAYHVLGRWNRKISNLNFIEKGFANLFLGGIPEGASDEEAVKDFKKAIELKPKYVNHYLELGITYEMMDNDKLAIEMFKKCLELAPSSAKDEKYKQIAKEHLDDLM